MEAPSLRIGTRITNALNSFFAFSLLDDAIADILCVDTYTHGTSPKNYHNIMKMGADPTRGGVGGETAYLESEGRNVYQEYNLNHFFVFSRDCNELVKRWMPNLYSFYACFSENTSPTQSQVTQITIYVLSLLEALFCVPVLKFRMKQSEASRFTRDLTMGELLVADYTDIAIPADRIGLLGSFNAGWDNQLYSRIQANPWQFAYGLLKMVVAVLFIADIIFEFWLPGTIIYVVIKTIQTAASFFVPLCYEFTCF